MIKWIIFGEISDDELSSRIEYLTSTFKLYFEVYKKNKCLELMSFPTKKKIKFLFLVGHNNKIENYILKNKLRVSYLILISCYNNNVYKYLKTKNIKEVFTTADTRGITEIRDGKEIGFNFNITDFEINLYNSRNKDLLDNLHRLLRRITNE